MQSYPFTRRLFGLGAAAGIAGVAMTPRPSFSQSMTKLGFQSIWLNDPECLGYKLAIDRGFYKDAGIEIDYFPGGPNIVPEGSLLTGKAEIALTQMMTTAKAIVQKGAPLKIIGVQYQKSPLGVISMASRNITSPADLAGKKVAVPTLTAEIFKAFAKMHQIDGKVKVLPYAFNPAPLINGDIDAAIEFVTQLPIIIKETSGNDVNTMLFDDHGLPLFMDLVVVPTKTLQTKREALVGWMRASRKGWGENFKDPLKYPKIYHETWFKGSGSTLIAEEYFNKLQPSLMEHPKGIYTLTGEAIESNIASLEKVGVKATKDMWDLSVLAEA